MELLKDNFQRTFSYLRLSITDICNFRCTYCLPNGYQEYYKDPEHLNINEIERLVKAFSQLGFWKVRLTGGEPTLRRDILEIIERISPIDGIKRISISTNGYKLKEYANNFSKLGIYGLNVSIDSLDPYTFSKITGHDKLESIREGIEIALSLGIKVKINTVLMKGINDNEISGFIELTKKSPISVRFIELMGTGCNRFLFKNHHLPGESLLPILDKSGWSEGKRIEGDGPSRNFTHNDYLGTVGIIAPYSKDFCTQCNRLRVTSRAGLRLCLFSDGELSFRHLLQSDDQLEDLKDFVRKVIAKKEISHYLKENKYGNTENLAAMGG